MPFGIPCPDDDLPQAARLMGENNTRLQNLVYNIVFPIGQLITFNEKLIGTVHTRLRQRVKTIMGRPDAVITGVIEAIASKIDELLNANAVKLAGVQTAIAMAPARETPDIPAADVRKPAWPGPGAEAAVIVANEVRQHEADVSTLLHLLYLLGLTPAHVRQWLDKGTIPEVYLCPRPEVHAIEEIAPPPEIVSPTEAFVLPGSFAAAAVRPMQPASGFWED